MHAQDAPDSTPEFSKWETEAQRERVRCSRLHRELEQGWKEDELCSWLVCFSLTALWEYHSHIRQFAHSQCTIQWLFAELHGRHHHPLYNIFIALPQNPHPLATAPHSGFPPNSPYPGQPLAHFCLF